MPSHRGGFFAGLGAAVQIVLLGVGASVAYGILQDQVTAHLCVEYFTIGHVDYLNLGDPTLIAVEWGFIATWWAALLLGLGVALVARVGARPRLGARDLLRPTLVAMGGVGVVAALAGLVGYLAARSGWVYLVEPLASAVPRARHVAFLTDLWAPTATLRQSEYAVPRSRRAEVMVAEPWAADAAEDLVLASSAAMWDRLQDRLAAHFGRVEVRARVRRYLAGLLGRVERKNGWQLAEAIGEAGPQGVQRLLNAAVWDAEAVRDDLRAYVIAHLGDRQSGVLVVDETDFPKKGKASCGVAAQYCGSLGRSANAQVGVFLAYTSDKGVAFIDRALYLPRAWTSDRVRCAAAGVPAGTAFATKVSLAQRMLARTFAAGVPARWVVADCLYGRVHHLRRWLEGQGRPHVLGVMPGQGVVHDGRPQRAKALVASLPAEAWVPRSAGLGSQGERVHDWACVPLAEEAPEGMGRWLLVRRTPRDLTDLAYFRAYGPAETTPEELVRIAGGRWSVEEGFAQAKGEVGLDQYEVRRWTAWHRHITLCLLAQAYLAAVCAQARADQGGAASKGGHSGP